jgi:uncharacterized small protein (DUF1192 family)
MDKRYFVQTESIAQTLKEYAKNLKASDNEIDFRIVNVFTKYKNEGKSEYVELDASKAAKLKDPEFLNDKSLLIKQSFEIEVFKKDPNKKVPKVHIGSNKDKTKVVFVVGEGAKLKYSQKLVDFIRENIRKLMALHGYLIDIWDEEAELKEFFDVLENAQKVKYGQRQYITVAKTPLPRIKTVNDKLIERYKETQSVTDEYDRVNHKKRGFAFGIKKGDVILSYVKPKEGRAGRDCTGKYLPVSEPKVTHTPSFSISEDIEVKENQESIDYTAKKNGYVVFENNNYRIEQYMEVSVIDFKTTGDLDLGIDSDVRLVVNGSEELSDSIGQGIEVNAKEINVLKGTVGSGVIIHAAKVNISSTTHQNSKIFADEITINVHNGYAKGKNVYVKRLEGGIVEGGNVVVEQAVGGEIRAEEIHIDLLTSNSRVYASSLIEVTTLKGEDNEFMIDPTLFNGLKEEIESIKKELNRFGVAREKIYKEYKQKKVTLHQNESVIKKIKEKIANDKEQGVKVSAAYVDKIKKFQVLLKNVRTLGEEIILLNDEIERLKTELDVKQSIVLNAKVISKNRWSGYNKVSFSLVSPEIIKETTTEGKKQVILLKEGEEGEFKIDSEDLEELKDLEKE